MRNNTVILILQFPFETPQYLFSAVQCSVLILQRKKVRNETPAVRLLSPSSIQRRVRCRVKPNPIRVSKFRRHTHRWIELGKRSLTVGLRAVFHCTIDTFFLPGRSPPQENRLMLQWKTAGRPTVKFLSASSIQRWVCRRIFTSG